MQTSINELPIELQILIFDYLSLFELIECEKVCKSWHSLFLSPATSYLYRSIDIQKREGQLSYTWLTRKLSIHKPSILNFSGCRFDNASLSNLLFLASESLEILDISFHNLTSKFFTDLSFIHLKKLTINDSKLKDSNLELILSIPLLEGLNVNYNSALVGKPLVETDCALKALWFEGCERIEYFNVLLYVQRHGHGLEDLGIDGEYYSSEEVCNLLKFCPKLNKFAIEFANDMNSQLTYDILKPDWKYLKIRRALNIPKLSFQALFECSLSELAYLNLAECTYVDDSICTLISKNCPNLSSFILTWCSEVSDFGIFDIVLSCKSISFLDLTGLKEITDKSFPLVPLPIYSSLQTMILEKCNKISDEHLWKLSELHPSIKIKNYYGEFKEGWTGIAGFELKYKKNNKIHE